MSTDTPVTTSSAPISGLGEFIFPDGSKYSGEWLNSKQHGNGRLQCADGSSYHGGWCYGKKHGKGRDVTIDGSVYVGDFNYGHRHGIGVSIQATDGIPIGSHHASFAGDRYDGGWRYDFMHGPYKYTFFNGQSFTSSFIDGRCSEMEGQRAAILAVPGYSTPEGRAVACAEIKAKIGSGEQREKQDKAAAEYKAAVDSTTACSIYDPFAKLLHWDPVFISVTSAFIGYGSTREKAVSRALRGHADGLDTSKSIPLQGCTMKVSSSSSSYVISVSDPSRQTSCGVINTAVYEHFFSFKDPSSRDAFIARAQQQQLLQQQQQQKVFDQSDLSFSSTSFNIGETVTLQGLTSAEHNGCHAIVLSHLIEIDRIEVRITYPPDQAARLAPSVSVRGVNLKSISASDDSSMGGDVAL